MTLDGGAAANEQDALVAGPGDVFVEACPGAGKTRALVARFLRRAGEEPRRGVALLSFTNAAIDEARDRCAGQPDALRAPNFLGTFDGFINRYISTPAYRDARKRTPVFLESWARLDHSHIRLPGTDQWVRYELEWFAIDDVGQAHLEEQRIRGKYEAALCNFANANRGAIEGAATRRFADLFGKGYLSSSASRWLARRTLLGSHGSVFSRLLEARFAEIIVDEGQDCGEEEIAILRGLQAAGVAIVMVADMDQAIFEFRRAAPESVRGFASTLHQGPRLAGNYRSTPAICQLTASLRAGVGVDEAVGHNSTVSTPVALLRFSEPAALAAAIRTIAESEGIGPFELMVVAHRRRDALEAAGRHADVEVGSRKVAIVADAALKLGDLSTRPKERRAAIEAVERVILGLIPSVSLGGTPLDVACDQCGIPRRWLREIASRIVNSCNPRDCTPAVYAASLRAYVGGMPWPSPQATLDLSQHLKAVPQRKWDELLGLPDEQGFLVDTIHGVKGREFPAVAVVIPKLLRKDTDGRTSLDCWEQGFDSEARRVLYVGVSRAERLAILAVHQEHYERMKGLLKSAVVPLRLEAV